MTQELSATFPPAGSSASAARRLVECAIGQGPLRRFVDEALLLVTELVTNAIIHAGTDIDVRVTVDGERLHVDVGDQMTGPLHLPRPRQDEEPEGGRGLLLVDAIATEWGTTHHGTGKSVWFTLGDAEQLATRPQLPPVPTLPAGEPRRDIGWLTSLPSRIEQEMTPSDLVAELLHRLAEGLDRTDSWVYAVGPNDIAWELIASHDPLSKAPEPDVVRRAIARFDEARLGDVAGDITTDVTGNITVFALRGSAGVFGALAMRGDTALSDDDASLARLVGERIGVIVRDDRARTAQLRSRGYLALLAEASEMFAGTLDVQLAMTLAAQLIVPRFARWAAAWATTDRVPRLMAVAHADESQLQGVRKALSGVDGELLALRLATEMTEVFGQRPRLAQRHEWPPELRGSGDEKGSGTGGGIDTGIDAGEVLVLPLVARRRTLGMLVIGRPAGPSFAADDLGLLHDLARRTAVAVESARLYEESTSIARALQASLLPSALPRTPAVEFGARYAPAGEGNDVGGDFYDVFSLDGGGWGIAVGDVCGKGPEAAAITGMARDVLRLLVRDGRALPAALRRLNDAILDLGERGRFCTAVLGVVRPDGDQLSVTLSSAGHPAPALLRASGDVELVGPRGTLLGVLDDVELAQETITLDAGDALVFYTDGVTERRHGELMFGDHNLLECLRTVAGQSAEAIAEYLEVQVRRFGAARDDLAVLVVRATGHTD